MNAEHIKQFDDYYSKKQGQFWLDGVDDYWVIKAYNDRNKRICEIVDELNPQSILDIGCGTGDLTLMLKKDGRFIDGVEPSEVNARKFEQNTGIEPYLACAESLPFNSSRSFDIVILADVIEHVVDPQKALQEALRIIKVGGHLILTTPNKFADIVWSFGSKRMFNKVEVKDDLFSVKRLARLLIKVMLDIKEDCQIEEFKSEGIYPRSRILSWLFNPNSKMMMRLLRWLERFEILRYRQIVVIRKVK